MNAGPEKSSRDHDDPKESERRRGLWARLRGDFFAGILVTAPVAITIYIAFIFIDLIDRSVTPLIPEKYNPETYLPFGLPGLGLVVLAIVLTIIGALTTGMMGRWVVRSGERVLARMPVVRSLYATVKQIFETILAKKSNAFREAVLVEYPRRGIWAIGFITGRTEGEVRNLTADETVNVFVPTTPNPTAGFLLFFPRGDIVPLNMTVEEAIKMVISGGIVTPPDRRPAQEQATPVVSAAAHEEDDIKREKGGATVLVPNSGGEKNAS